MPEKPRLIEHRRRPSPAAIVLLHGFGGDPLATWGEFPALLATQPLLDSWDVYSIGYSTSLSFDLAGLWSADPELITLGGLLDAAADTPPLDQYKALAFMAHSMGGLMLQRALLSDRRLRQRVSHVLFFGTPSGGLEKASPFNFWKRQVRDMARDSPFISGLRREWAKEIEPSPPFVLASIAGDRDEFVPRASSLDPFPEPHRRVVYGNHLEIVKPEDAGHLGFKVAVKSLSGSGEAGVFDSARLAVESREFQRAIEMLWPHRAELDDRGLVTLALALESAGRQADAIAILEGTSGTGTDPLGVLAGRLKRRWLAERRRADAERALALYRQALERAEAKGDAVQAFYHAINCAFMELAYGSDAEAARELARRALRHCGACAANDVWRSATEGEAHLYLGNPTAALEAYGRAAAFSPKPWQVASIYQQAVRAADLAGDDTIALAITALFSRRAASGAG